jgi:hypothetical protein
MTATASDEGRNAPDLRQRQPHGAATDGEADGSPSKLQVLVDDVHDAPVADGNKPKKTIGRTPDGTGV